ncbi:MAG: pyridoxal 5'-phosphate synthase lyase subunit PdxS [Dehalococcoidia bacterium]
MTNNGNTNGTSAHASDTATWTVKAGLAQMLKGGVIMDVVTPEHAEVAQEAGACAVMALERVPSDIRAAGGVARMSHVKMIKEIQATVSIPVMAKARIGHFVEAQILEAIGVDYVDESEVLTPADDVHHIDKHNFKVPFVCGCRNLGEALRRISEGAAMIRTKGEAGTGDIVEAVRHMRSLWSDIRRIQGMREDELYVVAKDLQVPIDLVREVRRLGKLPVVNFSAGGVASPADAALMMQLGAEGVFVGSGIFKSGEHIEDRKQRLAAQRAMATSIVKAVTHFNDPHILAEVSMDIPDSMRGQSVASMPAAELLAGRGN